MNKIKQYVIENIQNDFPNDTFYWKMCDNIEILYGTKHFKREDYLGWPEDTWCDFVDRMKNIECVYITQELIDDLCQYKGINVEDEILKFAIFEFTRRN